MRPALLSTLLLLACTPPEPPARQVRDPLDLGASGELTTSLFEVWAQGELAALARAAWEAGRTPDGLGRAYTLDAQRQGLEQELEARRGFAEMRAVGYQQLRLLAELDGVRETEVRRSCSNAYGVSYQAPHARYQGDGLFNVGEHVSSFGGQVRWQIQPGGVDHGPALDADPRAPVVGWRAEVGSLLQRVIVADEPVVVPDPAPIGVPPASQTLVCRYHLLYRLFGEDGALVFLPRDGELALCDDERAGSSGIDQPVNLSLCAPDGRESCGDPRYWWSTDGQRLLDLGEDRVSPRILAADGSSEELIANELVAPFVPGQEQALEPADGGMSRGSKHFTTRRRISTLGLVTDYEYEGGLVARVVDPHGRTTEYGWDGALLRTVTAPGPGGSPARTEYHWRRYEWDPTRLLGVRCVRRTQRADGLHEGVEEDCPRRAYTALSRVVLPGAEPEERRTVRFSYDWPDGQVGFGALTRVEQPGGVTLRYAYGDGQTFSPLPPTWRDHQGLSTCPAGMEALLGFRLLRSVQATEAVEGETFLEPEPDLERLAGPCALSWTRSWHSGGRLERSAVCLSADPAFRGRTFASEVYDVREISRDDAPPSGPVGRLLHGKYFGDTGRLPLGPAPGAGHLFLAVERRGDHLLDARPTALVEVREDVWTHERLSYDAGLFGRGTLGNVVERRLESARGVEILTRTEYQRDPRYLERGLLRLETVVEVRGQRPEHVLEPPLPEEELPVLSRTEHRYDEVPPLHACAPRHRRSAEALPCAESPAGVRGTPLPARVVLGLRTSVTRYQDAAARAGAITARTLYYDNGLVAEGMDPLGRITRSVYDFDLCSAERAVRRTRVEPPAPRPGVHLATELAVDCFTGLSLSARDLSGATTCSKYDRDGRLVELAQPGDLLWPGGQEVVFDRDRCPTGEDGPTSWTEFLEVGLPSRQRRVEHVKNGAPGGRRQVVFADGAGRALQSCTELDPLWHGGLAAACTWTEYDPAGRAVRQTAPVKLAVLPEQATRPPPGAHATVTEYDGLGREVALIQPGGFRTERRYGGAGALLETRVSSPRGEGQETLIQFGVLGHLVRTARRHEDCLDPALGPGWCATEHAVDALGRVLESREPIGKDGSGGAVSRAGYDDLGRQVRLEDPDRGASDLEYDAAGNLRLLHLPGEGAARHTVENEYDDLNRIVKKRLPAALSRPGEVLVEWSYDGQGPPAPVAGLELGRNAGGRLTAVSKGGLTSWTGYDERGRRRVALSRLDDGSLWVAAERYGHPTGTGAGAGAVLVEREVPHRPEEAAELELPLYDRTGAVVAYATRRPGAPPVACARHGQHPLVSDCVVRAVLRDAAGSTLEVEYGNGARSERRYHGGTNRLEAIETFDRSGARMGALALAFDPNGNVRRVLDWFDPATGAVRDPETDAAGPFSAEYRYDTLDRLVAMRDPSTGALLRGFAYDAADNLVLLGGRREQVEQRYGGVDDAGRPRPAHAVGQSAQALYAYDPRGNLRATSGRPGGDLELEYNGENMPEVLRLSGGGRVEKHFLGERLWKRVEGQRTTYYLGALVLVREGAQELRFVELGGYAERDPRAGGALFFHHPDHLGTATLISGPDGLLADRSVFWPFGEARWPESDEGRRHAPRRRFGGKEWEPLSGTYDFGARIYDPALGRWWSADDDPRDGSNGYAYVKNNPLSATDPDGHKTCFRAPNGSEHCQEDGAVGSYRHKGGVTQWAVLNGMLHWRGQRADGRWIWYPNTDVRFQLTGDASGVHWVYRRDGQARFARELGNSQVLEGARRLSEYGFEVETFILGGDLVTAGKLTLGGAKLAWRGVRAGREALELGTVAWQSARRLLFRSPEQIARDVERIMDNTNVKNCLRAAVQQAITAARRGHDVRLVVLRSGVDPTQAHAVLEMQRAGQTVYLSWGRVFGSLGEVAKEGGLRGPYLEFRGALDDLIRYSVRNGWALQPLP